MPKEDPNDEAPEEREMRIAENRETLRYNLELFKERYWEVYQSYGFTFAEGYTAYLRDMNFSPDDDEDEQWRGR